MSQQYEYINHNNYAVHLAGPDGNEVMLRPHQKKMLDEYFDQYCTRGFIKRAGGTITAISNVANIKSIRHKVILTKTARPSQPVAKQSPPIAESAKTTRRLPSQPTAENRGKNSREVRKALQVAKMRSIQAPRQSKHKIVGRRVNANANKMLQANLEKNVIPISNNIGVGILSYNRATSLRRLIASILKYTNLSRTTLFVSDDASTDESTKNYLDELSANPNIVVLRNAERLGVAGNSNRLIRCLSRFNYGLILNDDVEVINTGWDSLYVDAMRKTGLHHMLYMQNGVYGAGHAKRYEKSGVKLLMVDTKPHGAVLAFDREMLVKCGYFDESYGLYGMEHVDWSRKAWELGVQGHGFWDIEGSEQHFIIHSDVSAVEGRVTLLHEARKVFDNRKPSRVGPTERSKVPEISYIVPFRNHAREDCIRTVVANLRAQRYPAIHIVLVEQDNATNVDVDSMHPVSYRLIATHDDLFNKSVAFNVGVSQAITPKVILHDADIMAPGHYTDRIAQTLDAYESCHLGGAVIYADEESTVNICKNGVVDIGTNCDRVVGYFEGGSLACTTEAYWKVGAFCQDFRGYGCFTPGNHVLIERGLHRGYVPIEDVNKFDRLYTHGGAYQACTPRSRHWTGNVLDIFVPGRVPIKGVTPEHPFLVRTDVDVYQWKKAIELQKGDEIANVGMFCKVSDMRERFYDGTVYNFDVEEDKSYVVNGLIVHNCEDCDFYARLSGASRWKEDRVFDFLHLWHGRVRGWDKHHENNKNFERKLKLLSISSRVNMQHRRLREQGWAEMLGKYVK